MFVKIHVVILLYLLELGILAEYCKNLGLEDEKKFPDSIFSTYTKEDSSVHLVRFNKSGYPFKSGFRMRISLGRLFDFKNNYYS